MKYKVLSAVLLVFLIFSFLSYASRYTPYLKTYFSAENPRTDLQTENPPKDYMNKLMRRNTDPLGLKESRALSQFLAEPQIKWVIRSEQRHILN